MPQNSRYHFRAITRADYPMIRDWLNQPHIGGWWGEAALEIALIEEYLENGPTDMRIVELAGAPFAFVQDYPAHHWPAPQYRGEAEDARAIDTFLGDPAFLGKGHVQAYLRQRAEELVAQGTSTILVDPDPNNARAIAAYKGAGFMPLEDRICEDGDRVLVMRYRQDAAPFQKEKAFAQSVC